MSDKPPERRMTKPTGRHKQRSAIRVSAEDYPSVPGRVVFTAGVVRGTGMLLDISTSGAHIYKPSKNVPKGIVIDLYFLQSGTERRLHAEAQVVRKTVEGFAVRFLHIERELETLVLAAATDPGSCSQDPDT
jgi:hypothetical protein